MLNIFFLGLISALAETGAEMVYPLIPLYLVSHFGAAPALIGIIEGTAESLAALTKIFGGYITDKFQKKKMAAFSGYAAGLLYKLALLFAGSWAGILAARAIDRAGKGLRTAPRDVLVSESAKKTDMGKAFGLHRALNMFGAALGILITYFVLRSFDGNSNYNYKRLFAISVVPTVLALSMFVFVKQKNSPRRPKERGLFWRDAKKINGQLKLYLLVVFIFTLGNSSNTFILLKAKAAGLGDADVILLYLAYSVVVSALSFPLGKISDRVGRKNLLVSGYAMFALCYLYFAFSDSHFSMTVAFVLYGVYMAAMAGAEYAYIAEISPPELKGTMFGLHSAIAGITLLPANIIAGFLWDFFGFKIPFIFGAGTSLSGALILVIFMKDLANPT